MASSVCARPASPFICSPGEASNVGGETAHRGRLKGNITFYRGRLLQPAAANSVASLGSARPSKRAQRDGPASGGLKVCAKPLGNQARETRPDSRSSRGPLRAAAVGVGGSVRVTGRPDCCDALRCSGPHARYTDRANEFITLAGRSG